ncbi:hypothetical protein DSO57_1022487 [Entomophthora muscae]|uniref:Uncharacterized protein n=1 Tax=Entomophthora muscae TaxID=34485 RepID=A0ACC2UC47_9FUNG|nr:hypothetical protein DSO57_1022487 [Entomophthora muscae]
MLKPLIFLTPQRKQQERAEKALFCSCFKENAFLRRENQKNKELVNEANKIFSVVQGWKGLGTRRGPVTNRVINGGAQEELPDLMDEVVIKPTDETGTNQEDETENHEQSPTGTLEGDHTPIFLTPGGEQQEGT